MKRIITFLMAFMMLLSIFMVPSLDAKAESDSGKYVYDDAGVLSDSEVQKLNNSLKSLSKKHDMVISVHTTDGRPYGSIMQYADDFYDSTYGNIDGCVFVIDMSDRSWYMSTCGDAMDVFTVAGIDYIADKMKDAGLSDGDYYEAFMEYVDQCDDFIKYEDKHGKPYDKGNLPKDKSAVIKKSILIGLVAGLIIATLILLGMYASMKSVAKKTEAKEYMVPGSLNVTYRNDSYLYSKTTRTAKQQSSGNGSHTSSSGTSHGGSGGHF